MHLRAFLASGLLLVTSTVASAQTNVTLQWNDGASLFDNKDAAAAEIGKHPPDTELVLTIQGTPLPTSPVSVTLTIVGQPTQTTTAKRSGSDLVATLPAAWFPAGADYNLVVNVGADQELAESWGEEAQVTGPLCAAEIRAASTLPVYWDSVGRGGGKRRPRTRAQSKDNPAEDGERRDRVELRFGPDGRRISPLPEHIDANDEIILYVIAPSDQLDSYRVEVVSGEYSPSYLNIYRGGDVSASRQSDTKKATKCEEKEFNVGRFTSGTLELAILFPDPSGNDDARVPHTLRINPLYHGTVRLGVYRTELDDPTFGVLTPEDGSTPQIFVADEGDRNVSYVIEYVPFVFGRRPWAGRDLLKPPRGWERIGLPVIGFSLDDPLENVFLGLDVELTRGVALAGGVHYGKRNQLADDLEIGSPFSGMAADIPTAERWDTEIYYGVSLDLMVIGTAFSSIFNTGP